MAKIPTFKDLMNPLLEALKALGGSATIEEIESKVIEQLKLPDEVTEVPHNPEKGTMTEVAYRLAWARTYLKNFGVIDNSERGVWSLKADAKVDPSQVVAKLREDKKQQKASKAPQLEGDEPPQEGGWRETLFHILTKTLKPDAFERLSQRVLRESGFVQVEVTGKSGDGGIDGRGIVRVSGLLSFYVIFQCKRFTGAVGAGAIRDFRGAMVGRADKGLFITTGTFTREAVKEATRDGAPPIDLVDGNQLADILKELKLGVKTELVEDVSVDPEWFAAI